MAKLISNHDPFHIHKILGLFVLIHFIYRFGLLFLTGSVFTTQQNQHEGEKENLFRATACVILHGLLSWSSLLLPLPVRRNFNAPLIWREFRLHSILFATRHVLATVLSLNDLWPSGLLLKTLLKISIVVGTSKIATYITIKYGGSKDKRTTNSMPYPEWTTEAQRAYCKFGYTKAQFLASVVIMYDDPFMNFAPLLGIQIAPLMMTLVRKNKCDAMMAHRIYSLALWIVHLGTGVQLYTSGDGETLLLVGVLTAMIMKGRLEYGFPTWMLWTFHGMMSCYFYPLYIHPFLKSFEEIKYLRFLSLSFLVPVLQQIQEIIDDPRPTIESVQYWPLLKLEQKHYDKGFLLNKTPKTTCVKTY